MSADLVKRLRDDSGDWLTDLAADRIEELEVKLAMAVDAIDWALTCWDEHNKHGYMMHGDWVPAARTTLAELKGEK